MLKGVGGAIVMAAAVLAAMPALAQRPGDWALMQYQGKAYWYPGIIQSIGASGIRMRYDDGSFETRPHNQVRPYDWRVGTHVECDWLGRGRYYGGRIAGLDGGSLRIRYDEDGSFENTSTARCRSR